jgi:hypothetical protein
MPTTPSFPDATSAATDAAKDAMNTAANAATQAADKASEVGRDAIDKLDASRGSVAQGLHATAGAIRSYAPDAVAQQARSTADAMETAADYIRARDLRSMTTDLTELVRRSPGPSLIAAIAIGFLLGAAIRRRD